MRANATLSGVGVMSSGAASGGGALSAVSAAAVVAVATGSVGAADGTSVAVATLVGADRSAIGPASAAGSVLVQSSATTARPAMETADAPATAITQEASLWIFPARALSEACWASSAASTRDRKSTRLN